MIKLLTGQAIHDVLIEVQHIDQKKFFTWDELPISTQEEFAQIAKRLNEDLGLCENCGERPVAPNVLLEVAGDNVCSDCCNPPIDEHDPKVQHIHMIFNPDGTLAGAITPPKGMSLDEYAQKWREEMSHYNFILGFPGPEGTETVTAKTLIQLQGLLKQHIAYPSDDLGVSYHIYVFKDDEQVGFGSYIRKRVEIQVIKEMGAAEGLNDALYEYAFNNA